MLQVEKFVLKISIYILYMFMNIQCIQHIYDYRAVKKFFLVTNDEDLFECYFQDIPCFSGAVLEVFCMNFLKTQCFFVQNLCKRDFTICCHHLQISVLSAWFTAVLVVTLFQVIIEVISIYI